MLCRTILRSSALRLQTRNASSLTLACTQLRKRPTIMTPSHFRGFAQAGSKGTGGKPGNPPPKKLTNASVRCDYMGTFYTVDVPIATFFEDAPNLLAKKIGEDADSLIFEMKTKEGEWVMLDDVDEEETNRGKIEMQAQKEDQSEDELDDEFSDGEGDGGLQNEAAILAVEDLASAAVSEGKVQKGQALDAAQARAWVTEQATVNEDVRSFILNTAGGFDHLVQCLQFPFAFSSCFDAESEN